MSRCYTEQRLKLGVRQLPALSQVKRPPVPGKRRIELTPQQRGRRGEVDGVDLNLRIISLLGDGAHYSAAGQVVAMRTASGVTWMMADRQGTANITIDNLTQTVAQRRQDPYGNPRVGGAVGYRFQQVDWSRIYGP